MRTGSKAGLPYAIGMAILCAAIGIAAVPQEGAFANETRAPAWLAAQAPTVKEPSHPDDPGVPEELGMRTTGTLRKLCQAGKEDQMWCGAYLIGIADTLTVFGNGGHKGGICWVSYDIERLRQVFTDWAHQHPEFRDFDMLLGATLAFREVWPCD